MYSVQKVLRARQPKTIIPTRGGIYIFVMHGLMLIGPTLPDDAALLLDESVTLGFLPYFENFLPCWILIARLSLLASFLGLVVLHFAIFVLLLVWFLFQCLFRL